MNNSNVKPELPYNGVTVKGVGRWVLVHVYHPSSFCFYSLLVVGTGSSRVNSPHFCGCLYLVLYDTVPGRVLYPSSRVPFSLGFLSDMTCVKGSFPRTLLTVRPTGGPLPEHVSSLVVHPCLSFSQVCSPLLLPSVVHSTSTHPVQREVVLPHPNHKETKVDVDVSLHPQSSITYEIIISVQVYWSFSWVVSLPYVHLRRRTSAPYPRFRTDDVWFMDGTNSDATDTTNFKFKVVV